MRKRLWVWMVAALAFAAGAAWGQSAGHIVGWGSQVLVAPSELDSLVAVSVGGGYSLALRSDVPLASGDDPALPLVAAPDAGAPPEAAGFQVLSLAPNPFNPSTEIAFDVARRDELCLEIHDAGGKLVRRVPLGPLGPGRHAVRWDGRDDEGLNAGSGVYFVRLRGAETVTRAVKAVLVR